MSCFGIDIKRWWKFEVRVIWRWGIKFDFEEFLRWNMLGLIVRFEFGLMFYFGYGEIISKDLIFLVNSECCEFWVFIFLELKFVIKNFFLSNWIGEGGFG